jgi:hypothetical protein
MLHILAEKHCLLNNMKNMVRTLSVPIPSIPYCASGQGLSSALLVDHNKFRLWELLKLDGSLPMPPQTPCP